eukprot:jgi/Bigna1/78607/fgenesh1_pg.56_\
MASGGREIVLLVSGTFNPPHIGHAEIGAHAAQCLIERGHKVRMVAYCPVHDNYVINKIWMKTSAQSGGENLGAGKSQRGGGGESNGAPSDRKSTERPNDDENTMFVPMAKRVELLSKILKHPSSERNLMKGVERRVIPYEHDRPGLLQKSAYWEKKLPNGYLKTVPTASLIKAFSSEYSEKGFRVAVVFGADQIAYMPSWNNIETLFSSADLVVVGRQLDRIKFASDPARFLGNFKQAHVDYVVPVSFQGRSSTAMRASIASLYQTLYTYGYFPGDVVDLINIKTSWRRHMRDSVKSNRAHFVAAGTAGRTAFIASLKDGPASMPGSISSSSSSGSGDDDESSLYHSQALFNALLLLCGAGVGVAIGSRWCSRL